MTQGHWPEHWKVALASVEMGRTEHKVKFPGRYKSFSCSFQGISESGCETSLGYTNQASKFTAF